MRARPHPEPPGSLAWLVLVAVLAAHVWVSSRIVPPATLPGPEPFYADDFSVHGAQGAILASQLPHTGRLWLYDPMIMAGYPLGATLFDLDNVGTVVLMALLRPLGSAVAFKLVVWLCLALAPVVTWRAARRLGALPAEAVAAAAAATVVAATAITFRIGMYANFAASYLAVLVVALAAEHLRRPSGRSFLALVSVATAGMFMHVVLPLLVLAPCSLLVLDASRRAPRQALLQAALVTLALLALNAVWLGPFLRFAPVVGWRYSHHFFQTGTLRASYHTLLVLGGWHLVLLGLGVVGLLAWSRRTRASLVVAYGTWVALLLTASLQGSRIPLVGVLEPAQLLVALAFALCPLAGMGAVALVRRGLGASGLPAAAVVVLAPLVFVPNLLVTLRKTAALPPLAAELPAEGRTFVAWLGAHTDRSARILVEDRLHLERPPRDHHVPSHPYFGTHLPAMLPALLERETIGGPFAEMPIQPHLADLSSGRFFGSDIGAWPPDRFAAQLERYNIGWIVAWSTPTRTYLDGHPEVAEPVGDAGVFRLFRAARRSSFFLVGSGRVEARYDALEVTDASPGGVVLKYHWYPGFCADPPLPVAAYPLAELAAPFVRVENGDTRHFTLRPTRGWLGGCG